MPRWEESLGTVTSCELEGKQRGVVSSVTDATEGTRRWRGQERLWEFTDEEVIGAHREKYSRQVVVVIQIGRQRY